MPRIRVAPGRSMARGPAGAARFGPATGIRSPATSTLQPSGGAVGVVDLSCWKAPFFHTPLGGCLPRREKRGVSPGELLGRGAGGGSAEKNSPVPTPRGAEGFEARGVLADFPRRYFTLPAVT